MMEAYAPLGENFAQYTPALITPAADMDVVDDWYVYWALGKRLGLQLNFAGTDLDMVNAPTTDDLLTLLAQRSQVPYDEVKRHAGGAIFERPVQTVLPPRDGKTARFDLAPLDVQGEINALFEFESPPIE